MMPLTDLGNPSIHPIATTSKPSSIRFPGKIDLRKRKLTVKKIYGFEVVAMACKDRLPDSSYL